jgi:hypothetical protein
MRQPLLCRRHHRCKTFGPFRYRRNPDGSHTWNLGGTHQYTSLPARVMSAGGVTAAIEGDARFDGTHKVACDGEGRDSELNEPVWDLRLKRMRVERERERRSALVTQHAAAERSIRADIGEARLVGDERWLEQATAALRELNDQLRLQLSMTPEKLDFPDEPPF